jgi:hypothetical protein
LSDQRVNRLSHVGPNIAAGKSPAGVSALLQLVKVQRLVRAM